MPLKIVIGDGLRSDFSISLRHIVIGYQEESCDERQCHNRGNQVFLQSQDISTGWPSEIRFDEAGRNSDI